MTSATTTSSEIAKNVYLNVKKMETNGPDGAHTIYIYSVSRIHPLPDVTMHL